MATDASPRPDQGDNMLIRSPFEDVELADLSLTSYVLGGAEARGDTLAIVDGVTGRTLTYRELGILVRRAAAGFAVQGVKKGDLLALCSPNCPEFVVAFYAASSAGAVITTINPLTTAHDMARQLAHSGAQWLVTTPDLFEAKCRDAAESAGLRTTFVFGEAAGAVNFASLLSCGHAAPTADLAPDDLALLPYSSGTTGLPKGVVLTHRSLVASLCQSREVHRVRAGDVVIAVLPLFHIYGLQVTMNLALSEGATIVTMPRFDMETLLRLVQDYRVTRAEIVPPIVLALAKQPIVDDYDLSSLRVITSAAAPLGAELARSCAGRLGCRVKQAYGMTELGGGTHFAPDTGRVPASPGSRAGWSTAQPGSMSGRASAASCWCARRPPCVAISTTPRPPPKQSMPKGGSTPATSSSPTRRVGSVSSTGSRSSSSTRATRWRRRSWRASSWRIRRSPTRPWLPVPTRRPATFPRPTSSCNRRLRLMS